MTEITDSAVPVDWAAAEELAITANELEKNPTEAEYAPCAPAASQVKNYANWAKDFTTWIQNSRKMALLRSPSLNQFSKPGEAERDFRIRLQQASREARDAAAEKLRAKYGPKIAALQERLRRAEAAKEREADQAKRAKLDTVISLGSTLLGAFLGRKAVSVGTMGKAATTMRSAGRAMGQAGDVGRAQETVEAVQQQLQELEAQFQAEVSAAASAADPANETLETRGIASHAHQHQRAPGGAGVAALQPRCRGSAEPRVLSRTAWRNSARRVKMPVNATQPVFIAHP